MTLKRCAHVSRRRVRDARGRHPFMRIQTFYIDDPDGNEVEIVTA